MNIAIVGMSCVFPGAPDLDTYYSNLRRGVDCIGEVPPGRIAPDEFVRNDKNFPMYCRRGGFVDAYAKFDPLRFGVMPIAAKGSEPDQLLALRVATDALEDAGYADRDFNRERTAVILGRGGYTTPARGRLETGLRGATQLTAALERLVPEIDRATLARVRRELLTQIDPPGTDSIISLVPNLTASRISQSLDLRGPASTVDAACASSLVAIDQGCRELMSGRSDMVLAGGVHVCLVDGFWQVFCMLGALSRSEQIRPFDRRADGLLVGEGLGIVVLKRLADAERDDDTIYAVLRGIGTSSDGSAATLLSPAVAGQVLALSRAWQDAQLDPKSIGFLEAHGTATPAGDAVELETIRQFFGADDSTAAKPVLGSVKSMIGHTMPAAGIAGLIKAALAVHHAQVFPTLHCEEPNPKLSATRFRVIGTAEAWESDVRRAAVSAFGFGGANAHAVLEQHCASRRRIMSTAKAKDSDYDIADFAYFSAATTDELLHRLTCNEQGGGNGPVRAFLFDPTPQRLERLQGVVQRGQTWHGREHLWFSANGLLSRGGKVAYLFPGIDSTFEPRVMDIARHLGRAARPLRVPRSTCEQAYAVMSVNKIMCQILDHVNVPVDYIAGHSIGEWSALLASGALTEEQFERFARGIATDELAMDGSRFAAASCDVARAAAVLEGLRDVVISHDNCPHQVLLCGRDAAIDAAVKRLEDGGVMCGHLPFRSGFHSPFFEPNVDYFRKQFQQLDLQAPQRQLWSATTCAPYPSDAEGMRALSLRHLMEPVRFRELIDNLYEAGTRVFLQVGTGSITNFVSDTLRGRPHLAMAANTKERGGMEQVSRVLAGLFVEGMNAFDFSKAKARRDNSIALDLGLPLAKQFAPLQIQTTAAPVASPPAALAQEFHAVLNAAEAAQREVLSLLSKRSQPRPAVTPPGEQTIEAVPREWSSRLELSPQNNPELLDHGLFPQRAGWNVVADTFPVVPFTMLVDIAMEHALAPFRDRVAVAVEDARARRWLEVSKAVLVEVACHYDGADRVKVTIGDNASCTVVLAARYPEPPPRDVPPVMGSWPFPMLGPEVYVKGRMFHGPAYRGISSFITMGENGIDATLATPSGRGGLLDNAGQVFGFWIAERYAADMLAFPIGAKRFRFFGPPPTVGEYVECQVRIQLERGETVATDMVLTRGGRVWALVEGWEDRRFETPPQLWAVIRNPREVFISAERPEGVSTLAESFQKSTSSDLLIGRYFNQAEKTALAAIQTPRARRSALFKIVVAKDAVRRYLYQRGVPTLYPAEIHVLCDEHGNWSATIPSGRSVHVAVAHADRFSAAYASESANVALALTPTHDAQRFDVTASTADGARIPDPLAVELLDGVPRGTTQIDNASVA